MIMPEDKRCANKSHLLVGYSVCSLTHELLDVLDRHLLVQFFEHLVALL